MTSLVKPSKSFSRLLLIGTASVAIIASAVVASAKENPQAVIQTPGVMDVPTDQRSLKEVTSGVTQTLTEQVAKIDSVERELAACYEAASRAKGLNADDEKRACHITNAANNIGVYQGLKVVLDDNATDFYGQAERSHFEVKILEDKLNSTKTQITISTTTSDTLLNNYKGKFAGLDPTKLSKNDEASLKQIVRLLEIEEIEVGDLKEEKSSLRKQITFNANVEGKLRDWAFGFEEAAKDLEVPIAREKAVIRKIHRGAVLEALLDEQKGVPADFSAMTVIFGEVSAYVDRSSLYPLPQAKTSTESPTLPSAPKATENAYEVLKRFYDQKEPQKVVENGRVTQ